MAAKFIAIVCALAGGAIAEASYGYGGGVSHVSESRPYYSYGYGINHYGKREAEASYGYGGYGLGVAYHPYGGSSYTYRSTQGIGKRSADAEPSYGYGGYGHGVAYHPYGGSSYTYRSVQGIGKRSADAEAEASYGYGYPGSYDVRVSVVEPYHGAAYNYGVRALGKREAEPEASYGYYGYGPGVAYHPYGGSSYTYRSVQGLHKRSAEPSLYGHYYGGASSHVVVDRPYSSYAVGVHHPY